MENNGIDLEMTNAQSGTAMDMGPELARSASMDVGPFLKVVQSSRDSSNLKAVFEARKGIKEHL